MLRFEKNNLPRKGHSIMEQKQQSIELGKSGINVSPLGFGAMLLGSSIDEQKSYMLLDEYISQGGNFIDTANNYAFWTEQGNSDTSEILLGRWMKKRNNRPDVVIASKCGARPIDEAAAMVDFINNIEGLSSQAIEKAVERSLENLQTNYIDVYYVHIDDRRVDLCEVMKTLDSLVKSGKVKALGCSNFTSWRLQEAQLIAQQNGYTPFSVIQQSFTYLNPRWRADFLYNETVTADLEDLLEYRSDTSLVAYSPLMGGYYTRPEKRENYWRKELYENTGNESRLAALSQMAAKYEVSENVIVLAWMLKRKVFAIPLISASRLEHIAENFGALSVDLSAEDLEYLENA